MSYLIVGLLQFQKMERGSYGILMVKVNFMHKLIKS